MSDWTPPKAGSPCWWEIPATDVPRAKAFYAKVFDWNFKPAEGSYTEDNIAMFGFEDEKVKGLGGGIVKTEKGNLTQGKGAIKMYLYVYDIEEALEKIKEAGGKVIGEKYREGEAGWIQDFEDTEGNYAGVYTMAKDK